MYIDDDDSFELLTQFLGKAFRLQQTLARSVNHVSLKNIEFQRESIKFGTSEGFFSHTQRV